MGVIVRSKISRAIDRLFAKARDSQLRGEASVIYLSSEAAIPSILKRRSDVKVIAVVRDSMDLLVSWHNQCLTHLDEDVADPEQVWRARIERLCGLVPDHQRLILVFDDLEREPAEVYKRIMRFFGVRDDGRREFLCESEFARPKSILMARLARAGQKYAPK
jgi:hypothetical protein